jgi:biotin-dependent carboxylase-like uncharacterized protein
VSALVVERIDCRMLVEDLGRPGWGHLGVPPSGALDPASLMLANRLVGNPETAAGLEILLGGVVLRVEASARIALTGAQLPIRVDGRLVPWGTPVSMANGSRLEVGRSPVGLRAWLAVAGGIDVPPVLGSRSTDTLSGLGPEPLSVGQRLPLGQHRKPPDGDAIAVPLPTETGPTTLRLRLGPRDDWFDRSPLDVWQESSLLVCPGSDRLAVRLSGEPLVRRRSGELPSEGVVTGAVQVAGDGQPLIFLADHPTTGGYPVVGVVDSADLARCAQLRPGDRVCFRAAR